MLFVITFVLNLFIRSPTALFNYFLLLLNVIHFCFFSGANPASPHIHCHPTDLPRLSLGNKILFDHFHTIPTDVSRDDWDQEIPGLLLHAAGDEDPR